jgi:hypothetical protein
MKALTLTQPWATLIAIGAKHIETRSWSTSYRGPLAIHAAKGLGSVGGKRGFYDLCYSQPFLSVLEPAMTGERDIAGFKVPHIDPGYLPMGAIVATCDLVDCVPTWADWASVEPYFTGQHGDHVWHVPPPEPERSFGDYTPGRFAWLLSNVKALPEPVPCKGALSLWKYEGAL